MEQRIINFINFIVGEKKISTWHGFYVRLLLVEIQRSNPRMLEQNNKGYPADNIDKDRDNIEQYLINKNLARVIGRDAAQGNELLLTEEGQVLIKCGGVAEYEKEKEIREIEKEGRIRLDEAVKRSSVANAQINERLYWTNLCIALSTYISATYYVYSGVSQYMKDHPKTPDSTISALWFFSWLATLIGTFLLISAMLPRSPRNKIR